MRYHEIQTFGSSIFSIKIYVSDSKREKPVTGKAPGYSFFFEVVVGVFAIEDLLLFPLV